jgi:hypothetical protein
MPLSPFRQPFRAAAHRVVGLGGNGGPAGGRRGSPGRRAPPQCARANIGGRRQHPLHALGHRGQEGRRQGQTGAYPNSHDALAMPPGGEGPLPADSPIVLAGWRRARTRPFSPRGHPHHCAADVLAQPRTSVGGRGTPHSDGARFRENAQNAAATCRSPSHVIYIGQIDV